MTAWLVAAGVAATAATLLYWRLRGPAPAIRWTLTVLRALAFTIVVGLVLDAPVSRSRPTAPWVFVDASLSMTRGHARLAQVAWDSGAAVRADSIFVFGDTVRHGDRATPSSDPVSRLRGVVDRTVISGRPAVIVTDGEVDDSSALDGLASGSRIVVLPRAPVHDAAIAAIDAPRAAVDGDSIAVRVTVVAGAAGAQAGWLALQLHDVPLGRWSLDAMSPWAERQLDIRVRAAGSRGPGVLRAVISSAGDAEPRNDTLSAALELSRAASAVFVSTSPDEDARFAMAVLRGALALPTRGFLRVSPGNWRREGVLSPATDREVRAAIREAPIVILHGDTSVFGLPRAATPAPLALLVPPETDDGEWYPAGAPPSPLSAALSALSLDSLPPVSAGQPATGDWVALEARRGREPVRRPVIVGSDMPRRVAIVTASGFWRWRFRGGAGADAYAALWGGIFDWLAAERADRRGAVPDASAFREGQPVRWRRGTSSDSVVRVTIRRQGARSRPAAARLDTLTLRFAPSVPVDETDPLPAGAYDVSVPGGTAVLVVNASTELLPAAPRVRSGRVGRRASVDAARRARGVGALYALAILLLCAEWLLRRRVGLR